MSLRQRFLLIVCLAVVALGTAGLAIAQLRSRSAWALESAAREHGEDAIEAMLQKIGTASAILAEERPALQGFVTGLVAPLGDASAGYCTVDGEIVLEANGPRFHAWAAHGRGPHPPGGSPGTGRHEDRDAAHDAGSRLLPLDREVITDLCESAPRDRTAHARAAAPQDVLILSARVTRGGLVAWMLVAVPPERSDDTDPAWAVKIGVMGLATLLLVLLAVDALAALRRGTADLEVGLLRLQKDLRAEIPRPRAGELSSIAAGVQAMAHHLADAHDRERGLERRLSHEQRLAGLGRVVAGVAHEVRNPLTGIKLKLDTMARRRLDDRSTRDVAICLQEIARLDRVVSTLLTVARTAQPERAALDLAELVDERLGQAEALARSREVRLSRTGATLREDLYYRLGVVRIEVPPLRARRQDIPLLVESFLRRTPGPRRAVSEAAMRRLTAHEWPGNVRQLRHVLENACVMSTAEVLDVADLDLPDDAPEAELWPHAAGPSSAEPALDDADLDLRSNLERVERRLIERALTLAKGNRAQAARLLGIRRALLYARMKHLRFADDGGEGQQ